MPLNYDEGGIVTGWTPPAAGITLVREEPRDGPPYAVAHLGCLVLGCGCARTRMSDGTVVDGYLPLPHEEAMRQRQQPAPPPQPDPPAPAAPPSQPPPEPHHDLCICTVCWTRKQWQQPAGRWVSDKEWESDPVPPEHHHDDRCRCDDCIRAADPDRCQHGHPIMDGLLCMACELAEQEALPKHEREKYQQVLTDALCDLSSAYAAVERYDSGSSLDIVVLDAIQKAQDEIRWAQKCSRLARERKDRDMQELIAKGPVHHLEPQALDTMRKLNSYDMALKRVACRAPYCSCVSFCTHDGHILQAPGQLLTEEN